MKTLKAILLTLVTAAALTGCQKSATNNASVTVTADSQEEPKESTSGDTVQFKEGHGIAFHPKVKAFIDLKVAEVSENKIAPKFTAQLHVIQGADTGVRKAALTSESGTEASGWLPATKAALIKLGQEVELRADLPGSTNVVKGIVKRLEKSPYATLGDYEVVIQTAALFDTGTRLTATFKTPEGEAVPTVPRSALLTTAQGQFVYAVNENFYLRTAVKAGAMNDDLVEITDGLYAGDQIVSSPVNSLWMAELQILRGGKPCTCGH